MDPSVIPSVLALLGVIVAGLLTMFSNKSGKHLDDRAQVTKDLMAMVEQLSKDKAELKEENQQLESERDKWRDKYYDLRDKPPATQQTTVVLQQPPQLQGGA